MPGGYLYIKVLLVAGTKDGKCEALYAVFEVGCGLLVT